MADKKYHWKAIGSPNTGDRWGRVYCEELDKEGCRAVSWQSGFPRHYGPVYDRPDGEAICKSEDIDA